MQIDLETLKTNGQQYIDQLVEALKKDAWESLKSSKLQNNTPEELEFMWILWSLGFTRGAEAATQITTELYEALNKQKL